jgi:undecaprenyl diphosphate synthase
VARPIYRPTDAPSIVHRGLQPADEDASHEAASAERPDNSSPTVASAEPSEGVIVGEAAEAMEPFTVAPEDLPRHVAIIMDGNRRWARKKGLDEFQGHAAGVEGVRAIIRHSVRRGVRVLSLYAFSRENWGRSDEEVDGLFQLLGRVIANETEELVRQGVRVRLLGRIEELPPETALSIRSALDATTGGERLQLNIAFNYSGRTELVDAARKIAARGLAPEQIDEDVVAASLYTAGLPDPDLVIRTADEQRLSNFLIWQAAYAELYFSPLLWPDFGPGAFDAALVEFASRHRRFGL